MKLCGFIGVCIWMWARSNCIIEAIPCLMFLDQPLSASGILMPWNWNSPLNRSHDSSTNDFRVKLSRQKFRRLPCHVRRKRSWTVLEFAVQLLRARGELRSAADATRPYHYICHTLHYLIWHNKHYLKSHHWYPSLYEVARRDWIGRHIALAQ